MVVVAQLVRVAVCGAAGRRFEPGQPPKKQKLRRNSKLFLLTFFKLYLPSLSIISRFSLLAISQAIAKAYCVLFAKASNSIFSTSSVAL